MSTPNGWTPQKDQEVTFTLEASEHAGGIVESVNESGSIAKVEVAPGNVIEMPAEYCERGRGWRIHGETPGATAVVKIHYGPDTRPVEEEDQRLVRITQDGHPQKGKVARLMASQDGKWVCKDDHTGEWLDIVAPNGLVFLEVKWAKFNVDKHAAAVSNRLYANTREPDRTIRRPAAG